MSRRRLAFAAVLSTSIAGFAPVVAPAHAATTESPAASGAAAPSAPVPTPSALTGTTRHSTTTHQVSSGTAAAAPAARSLRAAAAPAPAPTHGTAPTEFGFFGAAGDYISGGVPVYDVTDPKAIHVNGGAAGASSVSFDIQGPTAGDSWTLGMAAADAKPLAVGDYPNASRWGVGNTGTPTLSVYGDSRGCNVSYGSFTILEMTTDPVTGALATFNATFRQSCEQQSSPELTGFIRYDATKPTAVPTDLWAAVTGSEAGKTVIADASETTGRAPVTNYHFDWDDDTTTDSATPVVSHTFADSGAWHGVKVTATDAYGTTSSANTVVHPDTLSLSTTPAGGLSVTATATGISDAGVKSYDIDWGDQTPHGTTAKATHTYKKPGTYAIVATQVDNYGLAIATDPVQTTTLASDYTSVGPVRIMDTRDGTGLGGQTPKLTAAAPVHLLVAGVNGVPANATAVAINVTVTGNESGFGAVGVTPDNAPLETSNLNYAPGQTVPNMVIVPVAADGSIEFQKLGPGQTEVVADLFGYYTPTAAQGFASLDPYRALDTRDGTGWGGGRVATGRPIRMKVTGAGGVPATGVTAVAVNITVTETSAFGVIAAGPAGFTAGKTSWTSNLNYGDGQTIANMAIVPVDADGYIDLVNQGPGSASVVLDVNGYYSATAPAAYLPFTPFRVEDTREPTGSKIDAGWITSFGFTADKDGTPDPTTTALVTNTTVANTGAGGFLTVFPDPTPRGGPRGPVTPPNASNLNWGPGQIVPNLVFARPGANGYVSYYNGTPETASNGAIDLIVDVFGVYTTF